jgi:hypothetical protein
MPLQVRTRKNLTEGTHVALVGLSPATKLRVVTHIANHMRLGAYLVVRSAHRLRSLMYPQIDEDALLDAGRGRLAIQASGMFEF